MSISIIYHHEQRRYADEWENHLSRAGHEVTLAPIGSKVGSSSWQVKVRQDIEASDAVIALITPRAAKDEWFQWRINLASELEKGIIPVMVEKTIYAELSGTILAGRQTLVVAGESPSERVVAHVLNFLPKPTLHIRCFISYSRDDQEFAARLASDLKSKNIFVWRDVDDIAPGASWDHEIQNALNNCTHLLFVATSRSIKSENISNEIGYALSKRKSVIPLILEECELPLRVHRAQFIDFREGYDVALINLLSHLGV